MDLTLDEGHVYFTDWHGGRIARMAKDGPAVTSIATSLGFALRSPIVVDGTHVYCVTEAEMMKSAIVRVAKGSGSPSAPHVLVDDHPSIAGLVADEDHLYFTSFFDGAVRRVAKRDGSVGDIATGIRGPVGVAIDERNVYWASKDGGTVSMLPKTASRGDAPAIIARDLEGPYALAVDETHVYWSTALKEAGVIARAPREGGPVTTLAAAQDNPTSIAVSATHVYWSTMTTVCRVRKTGGPCEVLASGPAGPRGLPQLSAFAPKGLAVDGRSVFCVDVAGSGGVRRFES